MRDQGSGERKRRRGRGILTVLLCFVMMLAAVSAYAVPVYASEGREMPDLDAKGSISLTFSYYDESTGKTMPVADGNAVGLYKAAKVVVDNGFKYVVDDRFASVGGIPETDEELDKINLDLAEELAKIASEYDFDVAPQEMNAEGKVKFEDLEVGLYLIVQAKQGRGDDSKFTILPFLMTIPYYESDGSLTYDVDAETKPIAIVKEEVITPTPTRIPQTGQLWWPVMALGAAGAVFVAAGIIRRSRD